jgi:hypothetical protein
MSLNLTPERFEETAINFLDSIQPKGVGGSEGITKSYLKVLVSQFKTLYAEMVSLYGDPFVMRGEWDNATPYKYNEIVEDGYNLYRAKADNTGVPTSNTATWFLVLEGKPGPESLPIGKVEEGDLRAVSGDEVWRKTIIHNIVDISNSIGRTYSRYDDGDLVVGGTPYSNYQFNIEKNIGGVIKVRSRNNSTTPSAIGFYNTDTPQISSFMKDDSIQAISGYNDYEAVIPEGAVTVIISHRTDQGELVPIVNIDNVNSYVLAKLNKSSESLQESINNVQDNVDGVEIEVKKKQPSFLDLFTIKGRYLDKSGALIASSAYHCTDFIRIEQDSDIILDCRATAAIAPVWFYDANKTPISYLDTPNGTYEEYLVSKDLIPSNTEFIRVSDIIREDVISYVYSGIKPVGISDIINPEFNWFIQSGYTRFDNGNEASSGGYNRTDFLKLPRKFEYYLRVRLQVSAISFYNKDKEFISSIHSNESETYTIFEGVLEEDDYPENAYFFRCSTQNGQERKLIFNISEVIPTETNSDPEPNVFGSEKFFSNILPKRNIEYAAHWGGVLKTGQTPFIPEMSIWSLEAAKRAGFRYVQCNAGLTSDGERVMIHDPSINRTMVDLNGDELIGEHLVSNYTLEQLKSNFKYKSPIAKFRTSVLDIYEFLRVCREYSIIPIFNNTTFSSQEFDNIVSIVGDQFGIFSGSRQFNRPDIRYLVYCWRGSTEDSPTDAVSRMDAIGKPCIYAAYADVWNQPLSDALQKAGYLRAPASVYKENYWVTAKKWADFNVTDIFTPPSEHYNEIATSDLNWDDFNTTGEIIDEVLHLDVGDTITYESSTMYWMGKTVLNIAYSGVLRISCCTMNPTNSGNGTWDYERSDIDPVLELTPSILNDYAKLTLTAVEPTVIRYLTFKMVKI